MKKEKAKLSEFKILSIYLVIIALVVVAITLVFPITPILFPYSLYGSNSFWEGILINLHSTVLDFALFSLILFFFINRLNEKRKIEELHDSIEDLRFYHHPEATSKLVAAINRLNKLNQKEKIDLSKCYLENAFLNDTVIINSKFMGASLKGARLRRCMFSSSNFKGVNFVGSDANAADFKDCKMRNIKCNTSNFTGVFFDNVDFTRADLTGSNFKGASFKGANLDGVKFDDSVFERANFIGALNLDISSITKARSLRFAKFDTHIFDQIKIINPRLLK